MDDDEVSSTTPEEIQTSKKRSSDDNNENIRDTDVVQSENSQVHNTEPQMEFGKIYFIFAYFNSEYMPF